MGRNILGVALCAALSIGLLGTVGCPNSSDDESETIKVGVVLPTSGPIATYGEEAVNGIKLAEKQYDMDSLPKEVKFIYSDNKGDANETEKSVTQLIEVEKVSAILGSVASTNSLAGGKVANENQVPMMSPASTNVTVTKIGPYVSRICFIDTVQGSVAAKFAREKLELKTAYLLVDQDSDYSKGLADEFKATFEKAGGQVLGSANFQQKQDDFMPLVTRVAEAKPDLVFIPGYYGEVGIMLRQAKEAWKDIFKLGGDGWDSPNLFDHSDALVKCYITNHFSSDSDEEHVKKFVESYKEEYGKAPGAMAALGYDAAVAMLDAIKSAGSGDPEKIKDAINSLKGFKGVTGTITINEDRNAVKPVHVLQVTPNGFKTEAVYPPSEQ